jgi:4-amino-4-deoxy-L-arabinose transferase-like glycosyltransferase
MFGHAHLAALDMITTLFFVGALLALLEADRRGGGWWRFALAGTVWGLAMLVRIHGLLLLPPVVAWLVWRHRRRVAVPLIAWLAAGGATFFAGWPWLWIAPIAHLRQFLGTATGRQAIHVFYMGRVWDDVETPWHYPLVMFLVTVPLGLLLLGALGAWSKRRAGKSEASHLLVAGALVFVLLVFAVPGAPVYDGARLFLMVFPLWAILAAAGAAWVIEHKAWQGWRQELRVAAVMLFVALQGVGLLVYYPCELSHYNLAVGGLRGAEALGFEVNYWGDAVPEWLLAEAAQRAGGEQIIFGPNLASFQAPAVGSSSPALEKHQVALVGWDPQRTRPGPLCRFGLFYHRKADLPAVPREFWDRPALVEHRKRGVWVARLVELPGPWAQGGVQQARPGKGRQRPLKLRPQGGGL